ncbi:winged helix-turn-helix domain-containing protein [Pseudomonas gingeri]|uniref:Winged helix-turn-helix domain-containing protein n=1 Tax=Pseudomonas gingeri TaxID=117681 RepID=A0A7Y7YCW5_9PSED|nr:winged helix-turn-helix domain-containing protein [Pseudomonas gingeri]NWA05459.1 winged helix-turn-helix domain-containing protein [Pseudomonas gingeri]NWA18082.1 winged helix-turn-helix domain-containing protein [Pseudomonas gingeri]NWA59046.1 winged helix-turn-helix domain-containing protein [Pseudomonas gingeri]NWA99630.1 winged helix-turn-helix domain-containing protein [Pseudomonas gingeri]NWB06185.1 winged helix-turn-helix domain-containing protein [Pseudomonas gingeri]
MNSSDIVNIPAPGAVYTTGSLEHEIHFGPFKLVPWQQALFRNGQRITLGSRAMQLLICLASRAGELLEKKQLIALVWPKAIVEECNLRTQIRALRLVLEEDEQAPHIVTVAGRGYRFVTPTTLRPASRTIAIQPQPDYAASFLPRAIAQYQVNVNLSLAYSGPGTRPRDNLYRERPTML